MGSGVLAGRQRNRESGSAQFSRAPSRECRLHDAAELSGMGPEPAVGGKDERVGVAGELALEFLHGLRVDHVLSPFSLFHELHQLLADLRKQIETRLNLSL